MTTPDQPRDRGICGADTTMLEPFVSGGLCTLLAGHPGWHRCDAGMSWTEREQPAHADMRIEVVKRELNQGALAGFDSAVTDYAAQLVIAALDGYEASALQLAYERGGVAGRRQATEVWEREWGVDLYGRGAHCVLNEHAARGIAAGAPEDAQAKVASRLVGPWEAAEQAGGPDSPAAKMRSLRAHPHGSACICDDCTARDEAEAEQAGSDRDPA